MRSLFIALVLLISAAAQAEPHAEVTQAWSRATPPGMTMGVVYLTLQSHEDDQLVGASTPLATKVEMHESRMAKGVMSMQPLTAVALPRGSAVHFEPAGKHFMLIGLSKPLQVGETFPFTLKLAKAGTLTVTVNVRKEE